jgi:hypothetical protein
MCGHRHRNGGLELRHGLKHVGYCMDYHLTVASGRYVCHIREFVLVFAMKKCCTFGMLFNQMREQKFIIMFDKALRCRSE